MLMALGWGLISRSGGAVDDLVECEPAWGTGTSFRFEAPPHAGDLPRRREHPQSCLGQALGPR